MTNTNEYQKVNVPSEDAGFEHGLFIEELKTAYSNAKLHTKILGKLTEAVSNWESGKVFEDHLDVTEIHEKRIEEIFRLLGLSHSDEFDSNNHFHETINISEYASETMSSLLHETEKIIEENPKSISRDIPLINIARKIENSERDFYKKIHAYSEKTGNQDISELLQATLEEEDQIEKVIENIYESNLVNI